jgi:hypothetical protein
VDPGPFFGEKFLSLALQQQIARAALMNMRRARLLSTSPVDQLLIAPLRTVSGLTR